MKSPFWITDPNVLFNKNKISEIWPTEKMQFSEKLNAITRLVIALTLVGAFANNRGQILITGLVTIFCIVLLYLFKTKKTKNTTEGFYQQQESNNGTGKRKKYPAVSITEQNFTLPTTKNPVMNILPPERADNPHRKPAAPCFDKNIEEKINNDVQNIVANNFNDPSIKEKLFQDLGDKFTLDRSMRQWYSTPNTQTPNDQKSFAEWCYGDMISCKDGHELACTKGGTHRWTTQ